MQYNFIFYLSYYTYTLQGILCYITNMLRGLLQMGASITISSTYLYIKDKIKDKYLHGFCGLTDSKIDLCFPIEKKYSIYHIFSLLAIWSGQEFRYRFFL